MKNLIDIFDDKVTELLVKKGMKKRSAYVLTGWIIYLLWFCLVCAFIICF